MTRALVITTLEPIGPGFEIWGTYWRFRLFLEAICAVCRNITVVHLVTPKFLGLASGRSVSAEESAALGFPVTSHLVACRPERPNTFANHYMSGIFSVYEQNEFYWYAGPEQIEAVAEFLNQSFDLVLVHRFSAMIPVLRGNGRNSRIYFDLDDIVHRVRAQSALQPPFRPGKLGYLCQIPAMAIAERRAASRSRLTFVCSDVDRMRLKRLGFPRVAVVPNAVPIPPDCSSLPLAPTILFLARCDYPPNFVAAERLVRQIFPLIRAQVPEAKLVIAGKATLDLPSRREGHDRVEYLGYVEDLSPLYAATRIVCCPITSGSGTRLKLIEAAGFSRPIVATKFAAEGLEFRDGVDILFREDNNGIALACVQLMRDGRLCSSLGTAARCRVVQDYDAATIRSRIIKLIGLI